MDLPICVALKILCVVKHLQCPLDIKLSYQPVTEHHSLGPRRSDGQLEGRVEVMLLFVRAMHHLSAPYNQEAGVTEVTRVQSVTPSIQHHYAGGAASCKTR